MARVRNLIRANVLGLAQEILETRGPARQPSDEWLRWERQLWSLYRIQGQWQKLLQRSRELPPTFPPSIRREADLQIIKALTALRRGGVARALIRQRLRALDAPALHRRRLKQALIAGYVADDLLPEASLAMANFQQDYGSVETDWLLLVAAVLLQSGEPDAAINRLAVLRQPAARLLRLYARLGNHSLQPRQVIERARELLTAVSATKQPGPAGLERSIHAVIAQSHRQAGNIDELADAIEDYLLAAPSPDPQAGRAYPQFGAPDLFDAYAEIARRQANQAGLLVGEEARWLEHARALPVDSIGARKAMFAYLAASVAATRGPRAAALRQNAVDAYINALIDAKRTALIALLFNRGGESGPNAGAKLTAKPAALLGKLSLGGETGLRLSAHALDNGDIQLAADANANLSSLPRGVDRHAWLLQSARIDIFAGRHAQGAAKLDEWIVAFERLDAAQTDAVLQPIFDLQTAQRHQLALALLRTVNARAPSARYQREIAYWMGESYSGDRQYGVAADWFLHSALQQADGFDRWGEAARFRAAEALMNGQLFEDARRLFEGMLARATEEKSRNALRQKLQRLWLLESHSRATDHAR